MKKEEKSQVQSGFCLSPFPCFEFPAIPASPYLPSSSYFFFPPLSLLSNFISPLVWTYLILFKADCPLFLTNLILKSYSWGRYSEKICCVCLTRSLKSSETHAVNPKTQCSSKSCENHDALSQFCLKGSFAWVPEPTWGQFQIPISGHWLPVAHPLPTRRRTAASVQDCGSRSKAAVPPNGQSHHPHLQAGIPSHHQYHVH